MRTLSRFTLVSVLILTLASAPSAVALESTTPVQPVAPVSRMHPALPSIGSPRVLVVCIDFPDYQAPVPISTVRTRLCGNPNPRDGAYPYESLRAYYQRASLGKLDLRVDAYGWYRSPAPRSAIAMTVAGRQALIAQALGSLRASGVDLSRYDADKDGTIDWLMVLWAGPSDARSGFWWSYRTAWAGAQPWLGSTGIGNYSWSWSDDLQGGAQTAIHETGHALGLPDLYDCDRDIGPRGGVGGFDMMDAGSGDFNAYSKWLLGWITPTVVSTVDQALRLPPAETSGQAAVIMADPAASGPFSECYVVENRQLLGNDSANESDMRGLAIWHVDGRLAQSGGFAWNNSSTAHKLVALVQADGRGDIEAGRGFTDGDLWSTGESFNPSGTPSSSWYDGTPSGTTIDSIAFAGSTVTMRVCPDGMHRQVSEGANGVTVPAMARLSTPSAPSSVRRGHDFIVSGTMTPRHRAGTKAVRLTLDRLENGRWVARRSLLLPVYDARGGASAYRLHVRLPKGTWRVWVSHADAGHAASVSACKRIGVR